VLPLRLSLLVAFWSVWARRSRAACGVRVPISTNFDNDKSETLSDPNTVSDSNASPPRCTADRVRVLTSCWRMEADPHWGGAIA
jgi:hypothetical protein